MGICMCINESLHCTLGIQNIVNQLYFSIFLSNKKKTKMMPRKTMKPPFSCLFFCSAMGCERSQGGVERITPVMEAPSLKHWATREVPKESIFLSQVSFLHFFFHENIPLLKDRIFLNIFE